MTKPLLATEKLAVQRAGRRLLFDIALALEPGAILHLAGPNGIGKTSLLRTLAGLTPPAAGVIRLHGIPVTADPQGHRESCLMIAHENALKPALSVARNLAFWAAVWGADRSALSRARDLFAVADFWDRAVRTLSQGQKRRASLARLAFAAPQTLVLLDEPWVGLDEEASCLLAAEIRRLAAAGCAVVMTSHQPVPMADVPSLDLDRFAAPGGGMEEPA